MFRGLKVQGSEVQRFRVEGLEKRTSNIEHSTSKVECEKIKKQK
jgi:hypothetical protein